MDAAFQKTFKPEFSKNANEFYRDLRVIPDSKGPTGRSRDALQAAKGQMSPDDLREILTRVPVLAAQLGPRWLDSDDQQDRRRDAAGCRRQGP